ncbi:polyphosphate kinase 2 family protein [Nitrosopumilus sp.]|uniref:polyphosphate kinase 2 family protein n=1 Tax=Nitrosopumilus sp. TaxID=2024843 RepID=UPI002931844E|nr:polyphosphate kinase 2 family protein [Nitrosopumilus sp.]
MAQKLSEFLVKPDTKVDLKKISTTYDRDLQKEQSKIELDKLHLKMSKLQYKLHAEKKQALLIILQAMDAGGKDGTIRDVMHGFNPQGCKVTSFRVPNTEEISHDFLWRIHKKVPAKGEIGIFNRSHYGDVLIVRVHNMVPVKQWSKRYGHINDFEKMLTHEGVRILKFYLHISKDEQKTRLEKRITDPTKHWKIDEADYEERKHWNKYMHSYEHVLEKCSTTWAPWYIIPSDRKWYRNWAVAQIITETLEMMKPRLPRPMVDAEKFRSEN